MKIRAERDFNIFDLFLQDHEMSDDVNPFRPRELAQRLNERAFKLYPDYYVHFVSPDEHDLSWWIVRFNKTHCGCRRNYHRHECKYKTYPVVRSYCSEREFRSLLPIELDEVLFELNNQFIML